MSDGGDGECRELPGKGDGTAVVDPLRFAGCKDGRNLDCLLNDE